MKHRAIIIQILKWEERGEYFQLPLMVSRDKEEYDFLNCQNFGMEGALTKAAKGLKRKLSRERKVHCVEDLGIMGTGFCLSIKRPHPEYRVGNIIEMNIEIKVEP